MTSKIRYSARVEKEDGCVHMISLAQMRVLFDGN